MVIAHLLRLRTAVLMIDGSKPCLINTMPPGVREQFLRRESVFVPVWVRVWGMKNGNPTIYEKRELSSGTKFLHV